MVTSDEMVLSVWIWQHWDLLHAYPGTLHFVIWTNDKYNQVQPKQRDVNLEWNVAFICGIVYWLLEARKTFKRKGCMLFPKVITFLNFFLTAEGWKNTGYLAWWQGRSADIKGPAKKNQKQPTELSHKVRLAATVVLFNLKILTIVFPIHVKVRNTRFVMS